MLVVSCIYLFKSIKRGPLIFFYSFTFWSRALSPTRAPFFIEKKKKAGPHTQARPPPHSTPSNISAQWPDEKPHTHVHSLLMQELIALIVDVLVRSESEITVKFLSLS